MILVIAQRSTEARSCNHCCSGKAISITYSECVFVALDIQHAMHMRHLESVACPAVQYISTLSHTWHDFRGVGKLLNIKYMF
jgi:hypothetical protein